MNSDIKTEVIMAVRALYRSDQLAQRFFDWSASCERDATETSIERIASKVKVPRADAVALARRLEETNCGEFVVGRRGQPSRFVWFYSRIKLGQAAAGELSEIGQPEDPISEADNSDLADVGLANEITSPPLSISEAKRALARSLGIPEANIEITIKA